MIPLIILLAVLNIIIVFYIIQYYFATKSLAKNIHLSENPTDISSNEITNPRSILYTFGTWVYVNNFSNATLMNYVTASSGSVPLFSLVLGGVNNDGFKNKPTLRAMITGTSSTGNAVNEIIISRNFPIQKWVYVTISVDTTYVDCYLDGKLVISKKLENQITSSPTVDPYITFKGPAGQTQSPDIYLTKLARWDKPLDPQSVWNEYSSGNGVNQNDYSFGVYAKSDGTTNNYKIYSTK